MNRLICMVVVVVLLAGVARGDPILFDDFLGPTLDPAWEVREYTGPWPRAEGEMSSANHYALENGALRYYVDPMTHGDGFVNHYQTSHEYYDYDPGLELHRVFDGDSWVFESEVRYNIPFSNYRGFYTALSFGDGQTGSTYQLVFRRQSDVCATCNRKAAELTRFDPDLANATSLGWVGVPGLTTTDDTLYLRAERSGGLLTAMWSTDGTTWDTPLSIDLGNQLDGLEQRLILSGASWFNDMGSYADYDYVRIVPEPASLLLLGLGAGMVGWMRRRRAD